MTGITAKRILQTETKMTEVGSRPVKTTRCYMAGPINNCTDEEAYGWRRDLKKLDMPGIVWVDPLDRDYRGREMLNSKDIVQNDLEAIRKSDVVLAYLWKEDQPYFGTSMEIMYAWMIGVPVVSVMPFPLNVKGEKLLAEIGGKNPSFHPWIKEMSVCVCYTLDDALAKVREIAERRGAK